MAKKEIAVDDFSAFYLQPLTFFMSFKMFLARFACPTAKKKIKKGRGKKKKQDIKKTQKKKKNTCNDKTS